MLAAMDGGELAAAPDAGAPVEDTAATTLPPGEEGTSEDAVERGTDETGEATGGTENQTAP
jgi:hypothetical protein